VEEQEAVEFYKQKHLEKMLKLEKFLLLGAVSLGFWKQHPF